MTTPPLTNEQWFELVLGTVVKHQERMKQPPQPMTEREGLMPLGQSTLHPFQRDYDGTPRDVSIHAREDL